MDDQFSANAVTADVSSPAFRLVTMHGLRSGP